MTDMFSPSAPGGTNPVPGTAGDPSARRQRKPDPLSDFAVTVYYQFTVDGIDLGVFTKVGGLGVSFDVTPVQSGGGGAWVHQMIGRVKYDNLRLERPVNPDTKKVMSWLTSVAQQPKPTTAVLKAISPHGESIMEWNFTGVVPVRWTGPSFDISGSPQTAMESLELAYRGFL